jgi:hypothetical protein
MAKIENTQAELEAAIRGAGYSSVEIDPDGYRGPSA